MKNNFWVLLVLCFLAGRTSAEDGGVRKDASLMAQSVSGTKSVAAQALTCPKCHSEMEEGVFPIGGSGTAAPLVWLKKSAVTNPDKFRSSAKWGFWTPAMQVVKGGWNQTSVISAFRCKNCGYLEAYAK